jgi:inosine-uridine nucleoside N-ribohydrolase
LRSPGIDLRAVTTVSGDTGVRSAIAAGLLTLAGRDDIEVAMGIGGNRAVDGMSPWGGDEAQLLGLLPEPTGPESERTAIEVLLEVDGGHIATVGMQTNMAMALDADPHLADRVERLTVMGGVFGPIDYLGNPLPVTIDHNLNCDPESAVQVLNAGLPMLITPCDVTMAAYLRRQDVDRLRQGDDLCRALAAMIDRWHPPVERGPVSDDVACLLHDPLAVATVLDGDFVTAETLPVTTVIHDGFVRTLIDPAAGRPVEVVRSVDLEAFRELWVETVLGRV